MKKALRTGGFLLLESMIAVAVFAIGVIGLGTCVESCLTADRVKNDDARARRALENRMAEVEAGATPVSDKATEELRGAFAGMTLKTSRVPLKRKNEKGQDLFGIFAVTLQLSWQADGQTQSKELSFYVYPRQR